ncbi:MAG: TonB-dependent receptor [Thiobacillaceae bacterium]|nr:TonB-dependent receptor [Thiobacillaceae bacterium]
MSRRLWGLFAAVWMYAAAAQELSEALFLAELPQVLTASRIATAPHEAPAPVTVLDRATIRATGLTELHDLLRLVPGFLVADWPGGSPVVVNRGLGDAHPNRLLVLLDGHSVVNPATGAVDWHDLPLRVEDIERIEVVRGPNQASYGAGAFQGVVQIFTRDQAEDTGIGLTLARGRFGFADTYARAGHSGGQVAWRLSLSQRQALNFRDRQVHAYGMHEAIERLSLLAQLAYRSGLDEEWLLSLGTSDGADWVGSTLDAGLEPYRQRRHQQVSLRLAWHNHYATGAQWSLEYSRLQRRKREAGVLSLSGLSTPVHDDLTAS